MGTARRASATAASDIRIPKKEPARILLFVELETGTTASWNGRASAITALFSAQNESVLLKRQSYVTSSSD